MALSTRCCPSSDDEADSRRKRHFFGYAAVRLALIDVRERRMDREVPEGCEVWPAPEQLRQSADLRLVAEQGPALPDKPVRGRVGLRHGVPARQTGKRRHQRRVAPEVDVTR